MTISSGSVISSADLNSLYTSGLTNLRSYISRRKEFSYIWNYSFSNIDAGTTSLSGGAKSLVQQSVEFTPPTDMNLKTLSLNVTAAVGDTFTLTLTGSTLLLPITLSVASNGGLNTSTYVYPAGTVSTTITTSKTLNTLLAGATYKLSVVNTGAITTNSINISIGATYGYRR